MKKPNTISHYIKLLLIWEIVYLRQIPARLILPILCFISFYCFAQQEAKTKIDTLKEKLLLAKEDTTKVKLLNTLSWQLIMTSSLEDSKRKAGLALALAEELSYKKGMAEAHNNIGFAYEMQGNYPAALKEFYTSLRIQEEAGNKKAIADIHSNLAVIYNDQKNYPELMKELQKALQLYKETGHKLEMAAMYSNIANAYNDQKKYTRALIEYKKALKLYEELRNKRFIAITHNNIGHVYNFQRKYNEALREQLIALHLREELEDKSGMAGTHNNIAIIYEHKGNFEEALKEYTAAEKIYTAMGSKNGMADAYIFIGNLKNKMNNPKDGKVLFLKGIALLKEIGDKNGIKNGYKGIITADSTLANFKEAFESQKMYILYRDSLINEENIKKTVKVQMEYTFDKKEAATRLEQEKKDIRQRDFRNSILTGLGGALIFLVVVYRQRNKIAKARKRSDELLLNILPEEVAEELKAKGSAEAKQFDEVTVMFTDFKGFTQISEKLTPTELVAEIHTCFKAFDNIITKYNVEKIKTIGDAYMCAGGLPIANTTNAVDVINAAIEIQQFMQQHLQLRKKENKEPFEIRIGVHTGPVVAGIVGVKKFAYDIWGDTVNTASRMESSGEAGKVNISGSTYELVKDQFNCTYRGKVQAKNKGEIDMYFLEGKT